LGLTKNQAVTFFNELKLRSKIMRVLAVTSQKGGSSKTNLSGHLAVQAELAGAGPVVMVEPTPKPEPEPEDNGVPGLLGHDG
jgi:Mrp family chromosome partitioning ATPase